MLTIEYDDLIARERWDELWAWFDHLDAIAEYERMCRDCGGES